MVTISMYWTLKYVSFVIDYKVLTVHGKGKQKKENDKTFKFVKYVSTESSVIFS